MAPKKVQQHAQEAEEVQQPQQMASFADFGLSQQLLDKIRANGFERPSEVQQIAIPHCLERKDVLCQAKSGKGKTCVFVLSVLQLLDMQQKEVQALVLCHTHELALQISQEFERFASEEIKVLRAVGKIPIHIQKKKLEETNPQIVVGTLGRLVDLCEKKILNLEKLKFLVVDEADNLMSDKSVDQFAKVLSFMGNKNERQSMVFSATYTEESLKRIQDLLREGFKEIRLDDKNLVLHGLVQRYCLLTEPEKLYMLLKLLTKSFTQAVIFTKSTDRCRVLQDYLQSQQIDTQAFYGYLNTKQRDTMYQQFKKRDIRVMVATDIFQRGVDFEGVNLVVHFDMPDNCDSYLHRSGRAGRFETNGLVVSFVCGDEDKKVLDEIQARFAVQIEQLASVDDIDEKRCFLK